ncbi:Putative Cyclin domain-containing protein [Rhizopus microsporus]|nr:Putative Cyclin domain-containing protein [Rhizopus microsporus]
MFIAAVVLASKFIEDSNSIVQSVHKFVSPLYSPREVNEMERSFLAVVKVIFKEYMHYSFLY